MVENVAVVGATGLVGRTMLKVLEERNFPVKKLFLFASARSAGKGIVFRGREYAVNELTESAAKDRRADIALFSAGSGVSEKFAPIFAENGTVIDNSSCWRMRDGIPLVVPEVNPEAAFGHGNIIANPNCSTIQAVVALKPLHDAFGIKRIVYSTYQAVSGAGMKGLSDLENDESNKFPHRIAHNIIPHIDDFTETGYTKEELKMINETRKLLGEPKLAITATTVRVPVYYGHCESINIEFRRPVTRESATAVLSRAPGVVLCDDPENNVYPMPIDVRGRDEVFVGRIRADRSVENGLNIWVAADNIRKGAATNAVQIAELIARGR